VISAPIAPSHWSMPGMSPTPPLRGATCSTHTAPRAENQERFPVRGLMPPAYRPSMSTSLPPAQTRVRPGRAGGLAVTVLARFSRCSGGTAGRTRRNSGSGKVGSLSRRGRAHRRGRAAECEQEVGGHARRPARRGHRDRVHRARATYREDLPGPGAAQAGRWSGIGNPAWVIRMSAEAAAGPYCAIRLRVCWRTAQGGGGGGGGCGVGGWCRAARAAFPPVHDCLPTPYRRALPDRGARGGSCP